ncbi:hypothetical protein H7H78_17240 [Mycobacterium shinjukuense]|uniref:Uncharacterized protein n=1 Tax=Mycobacterium shinjukuense TaxID=398694 RepID=A0A7I7MPR3_9MYCO|nr:hypothetical protein [Mycobacterium shinjukuense]MCV6987092.1 hypothetical protein [Mycobacterium shinjukuense]ORB61644.1 hypothetical protein BST45_19795 [Mycobacterium shinjukuense]BBX72217.1 hypothetical protein MSHI_01230 [Mycobacterium shinjukuense]BBX73910.1 hypothetical protein MSHI_18160 [Mycobacterium shinjukuense]
MTAPRVRAVTIGNGFAVRGVLLAGREELWVGPLRPADQHERALYDAHQEAGRRGWEVAR